MVARQDLRIIPFKVEAARLTLIGASQEELGVKLGVHARSVQNWEAGSSQPHPKHVRRLAELAGVSVAWFYTADDGMAA